MSGQIQKNTARVLQTLSFCVVVLSLVMGAFSTSAYAKSALGGPATLACSHVYFIGIRGSGEPKRSSELDMGGVVSQVYTRFYSKMKDKGIAVSPEGLQYEAAAVTEPWLMPSSLQGGVDFLTRALLRKEAACSVLVGYSQGAWVIHDTLDQLPSSLRGKVKAVLTFGDPLFDPKSRQSIVYGDYDSWKHRLAGGTNGEKDFPSWVFGVQSYCNAYDPFCDKDDLDGQVGGLQVSYIDCGAAILGGYGCHIRSTLVRCAPSFVLQNAGKHLKTVQTFANKLCKHLDYYTNQTLQEDAATYMASLFARSIAPVSPGFYGDWTGVIVNTTHNHSGRMYLYIQNTSSGCQGRFQVDSAMVGTGNIACGISNNAIGFVVHPDNSQLSIMHFNGSLQNDGSIQGSWHVNPPIGIQQGTFVVYRLHTS